TQGATASPAIMQTFIALDFTLLQSPTMTGVFAFKVQSFTIFLATLFVYLFSKGKQTCTIIIHNDITLMLIVLDLCAQYMFILMALGKKNRIEILISFGTG
ncbi:hypothetical protein ACJX0J_022896, partial [Zea mays]